MDNVRKQTLIIQLFPFFPTPEHAAGFENLLRSARLVVDAHGMRVLADKFRSQALGSVHAWLRTMVDGWDGPVALFVWFHQNLEGTLSSLGTIDWRIPEMRRSRKIVVVPDAAWPSVVPEDSLIPGAGHFDTPYKGMREDGQSDMRPALVMRLGSQPDFKTAIELGVFLGTRTSRQSVTNMQAVVLPPASEADPPPFQIGVPSKPPRDAEPTLSLTTGLQPSVAARKRPSQAAIEAARLPTSGRPDPRAEDQDRISTIPPGPGEGPPDITFPPRDDATEPKVKT